MLGNEKFNENAVTKILDRLSPKRFDDFQDWRDFVWMMKNMGQDDATIHKYSAKSSKYSEEEVDRKIEEFDPDKCHMSISKLLSWYKQDCTEAFTATDGKESAEHHAQLDYMELVGEVVFNKDQWNATRGDIGMANLFYKYWGKNNVITTDYTGDCYMWEVKRRIWKPKHAQFLQNRVGLELEKILKMVMKNHLEQLDDEDATTTLKKKYGFLIKKVQQNHHLKGMMKMLLTLTHRDDFEVIKNSASFMLPIKMGKIINLQTLEVRDRERRDYFTFELPVSFQKGDYSNALAFFKGISCDDMELVSFFQRWLGYCLTGDTRDRSLYILWGIGLNGKSTLVNIMKKIMADFYVSCDESVLLKRDRRGGATPELIPLQTARFAILPETEENDKLNPCRVKSLTGNDSISARALYKQQIVFTPKCKIAMMTNKKPEFDCQDIAIVDRLKLIPFLARFKKDQTYEDKLCGQYLDEIFSWICLGAHKWLNGETLKPTEVMRHEKQAYIMEQDTCAQFFEQMVEKGDEKNNEYRVVKGVLYDAYAKWCDNETDQTVSTKTKFYSAVANQQNIKTIKSKGKNIFVGIKLLN